MIGSFITLIKCYMTKVAIYTIINKRRVLHLQTLLLTVRLFLHYVDYALEQETNVILGT
jgi:hypothetical protein